MSLASIFEEEIRHLYGILGTQQAVADELGVTRQFIQQILSGKAKCSNITLGMVERMFPDAKLIIKSPVSNCSNSSSSSNVAQGNGNVIVSNSVPSYREHLLAYRLALQDAIIDLGLDPEGQAKILRVFRDTPME